MRKIGVITLLVLIISINALHSSEFIENKGIYSDGVVVLTMSECSVYNINENNYLHTEWVEFQLTALEGYTLTGPAHLIIEGKEYTLEAVHPDKKGNYIATGIKSFDLNEVSAVL